MLLVGLGGLWLISYFWARGLSRKLWLQRETQTGWVQAGTPIAERMSLTNSSRLPAPWVEVADHSTLPQEQAGFVTRLGGKRSARWKRKITCERRGYFTIGPTTLRTGDPFGVYTVILHYPQVTPLMVLPPVMSLPFIEVTPAGQIQLEKERAQAAAYTFTVGAAGVREYQPGDSLRWIHWRTSARREGFFVRLFETNILPTDCWILLDVNLEVQVGSGLDATDEHAVILAASLADQILQTGRPLGLAAHGDRLVWLAPNSGEEQRWEILQSLAKVSRGRNPLSHLLQRLQPSFRPHTNVVLITPSVDERWVRALQPLIQRGAIPTVLLLDPVSFGGDGNLKQMELILIELGVAYYIVPHSYLGNLSIQSQPQLDESSTTADSSNVTWKVLS
jgi:uncharacterized protein (DUF58 family)